MKKEINPMLTYETALALKNARFPQRNVFPCDICNDTRDDCAIAMDNKKKPPYQPSLEELIEACGEKFGGISRSKKGDWIAYGITAETLDDAIVGSTPSHAVANLYLTLNTK